MVAAQDALECLPELRTEYGVDDGIQRRVEITQPQEERRDLVVDLAFIAQRQQQRHQEEWQPADNEGAGDNGQRLGRLSFPFRFERFFSCSHLSMRIRRTVDGGRRCGGHAQSRRGYGLAGCR